ncbi:MAG TPA: 4-hydroxythreonine-4-phosphate dehydrogenase PdxA [Myxococcota bacterium]|nr:4-hydroxythreonine-4-phosphate dehydrogenase PdxA [Myxococcota bacterium]
MKVWRVGITLGDPAGIGPEVTERALERYLGAVNGFRVTLFGPAGMADALAERLGPRVEARVGAPFTGPLGQASLESGRASLDALDAAIDAAQRGDIDALVTAPISKTALAMAGSRDLGHTDILARGLGKGPVAMAFFTNRLKIVLATVHIPLRQVFTALTPERVVEVARLMHHSLRDWYGLPAPRLALAGLNPHAGEGGLLGHEEAEILMPAVKLARADGIVLSEPQPPDTVFRRAADGAFDAVVALYHDQGLIPVKVLAFGEAVNVTLGLRVPRTSPDHGTAYDRVGLGTARPDGMLAALEAAAQLGAPGGDTPTRFTTGESK